MQKILLVFIWVTYVFTNASVAGDSAGQEAINDERPNILWLIAEDLSPYIAAFGDSTVHTPNLDWLASQGVSYDNFYASAPVCAPARASLITGMYPNRIAANHMRTGPWFAGQITPQVVEMARRNMPENIIPYEAQPGPEVKMFSEVLRQEGYYCTNNAKEDYQFRKPVTAWDASNAQAHWRNREKDQPFFSVFTFMVTHESQIWAKAKDSLWVAEDLEVPVPPYLPDTEIVRQDIRRMYSNIKEMDAQVGKLLDELKEDGLLEKTVIFWFTDHGGPLPRQKRLLYDAGLKVPMIIRFPGEENATTRNDQMLSFVDMAPTVLSLAGIKPPSHMDGKAFLGKYKSAEDRKYVFAPADRFGATHDTNRAARDARFKYIKYYHPERSMFLHVQYRDQMPTMQELYRLRDEGGLTEAQALWFRESKPGEELFDVLNDLHEINNLAGDPRYREKLLELRQACEQWVSEKRDMNLGEEQELIRELWPGLEQPATSPPVVTIRNAKVAVSCPTEGASIGYKIVEPGQEPGPDNWKVYKEPFKAEAGKEVVIVAHRIGYSASGIIRKKMN